MKKLVTWALAVTVLVAGLFLLITQVFAVQLGQRGFQRAVKAQLETDNMAALGPGLHVVTVGTGAPLPDPARAGPMTAIVAGGRLFVVDAGSGSVRNLGRFGLPVGRVEAVFLTHFHSDHIDGLGELMLMRWANGGHDAPLPVLGPPGTSRVVDGFNTAYALDATYRVAHHGEAVVPRSGFGGEASVFEMPETGAEQIVYDREGVRVVMFPVSHDPVYPAVGYRFEHAGRSAVISGDTTYNEGLVRAARGADLLVHEALNADMVGEVETQAEANGRARAAKIMRDIPDYHTTPVEAARAAREAGAGMLVLSHLVPALPDRRLVPYFLDGVKKEWNGPVVVAEDGDVFSLPSETEDIKRGDLR